MVLCDRGIFRIIVLLWGSDSFSYYEGEDGVLRMEFWFGKCFCRGWGYFVGRGGSRRRV